MTRVLALSPHLDDAVFSCGGILAGLADGGARVALVTAFTASVPEPRGFALRCQTDKGLDPAVDYMALRRAEDRRAAAVLGIEEVVHLDLPEAPHRGYHSPAALFHRVLPGDRVDEALHGRLDALGEPGLVLVPCTVGRHVDHRQLRRAVPHRWRDRTAVYRETPYALRAPDPGPGDRPHDITAHLERKLDACAAYASQLGFQFGGVDAMREALRTFALAEGRRLGLSAAAEALRGAALP